MPLNHLGDGPPAVFCGADVPLVNAAGRIVFLEEGEEPLGVLARLAEAGGDGRAVSSEASRDRGPDASRPAGHKDHAAVHGRATHP